MDLRGWFRLFSVALFSLVLTTKEAQSFLARNNRSKSPDVHQEQGGKNVRESLEIHPRQQQQLRKLGKTDDRTGGRHEESSALHHIAQKQHQPQNKGGLNYRDCNLDIGSRLACGPDGISPEECRDSRHCCYDDNMETDSPQCYHSPFTINTKCQMEEYNRTACGLTITDKYECLLKGCCWQPTDLEGAPWCYRAKVLPIFEGECGKPAVYSQILHRGSRIVGGYEAVPHSLPWMASLQRNGGHFCGGSLINKQWVVTAAHCFNGGLISSLDPGRVSVVLGLHSLSSKDDGTLVESREIDTVISHQDWNSDSYSNDIALIKLKYPITLTDNISPICLPLMGETISYGEECYTAGWGTQHYSAVHGVLSDSLEQVRIQTINTHLCNDWYNGMVDNTMICAGFPHGRKDSCQGDSGGPLLYRNGHHWKLAGVVSWGIECGMAKQPGVYARVSNYIDWIQLQINDHS